MGIHDQERERAKRDRTAEPAAAPPDLREPRSISQILMLQRSAGNAAVATTRLHRHPQEKGDEAVLADPPAGWDALNVEFTQLLARLTKLNATEPLIGERGDIIDELTRLFAAIGAPGEKSDAELRVLGKRLAAFQRELEEDHALAHEALAVLEEEYKEERARLAASKEVSDRRAGEILGESHAHARRRLQAAGRFARPEDIGPLAYDFAGEHHIAKAWEEAVQNLDGGSSWPWPVFKVTQSVIEGGAKGMHEAAHMQAKITQQADSVLRNRIRMAAATAIDLGENPAAVERWAAAARQQGLAQVRDLAEQASRYERWAGKLHLAGKLTIWFDIGASTIDVWAASPKERPKKIFIHASRIAGGLAGMSAGARVGIKVGRFFGPKGAAVGGLIGGTAGAIAGAWGVKKIAKFIADDIWPTDETYWEEDKATGPRP